MIICGYYRLLHSNNTQSVMTWIIFKLTIAYFNFNIYDLGITNTSASTIWLSSYLIKNKSISEPNTIYPHLKSIFYDKTHQTIYHPDKMMDIMSQNYIDKNDDCIKAKQFNKFYEWFIGCCNIVRDLFPYYKTTRVARTKQVKYISSSPLDSVFDHPNDTITRLSNESFGTFTLQISCIPNCIDMAVKCNQYTLYCNGGNIRYYCLKRLSDGSYMTYDGNLNRCNLYNIRYYIWKKEQWFPNLEVIMDSLHDDLLTFHGSTQTLSPRLKQTIPNVIFNTIAESNSIPHFQPAMPVNVTLDCVEVVKVSDDRFDDILNSKYEKAADLPEWLEEMGDYDRCTKIIVCGYLRLYSKKYYKSLPITKGIVGACVSYYGFNLYQHTKIRKRQAATLWLQSYTKTNLHLARIHDLTPLLITRFIKITHCYTRQPTKQQLADCLNRFKNDSDDECIEDYKFDSFYKWFFGICCIISDLRDAYQRAGDPLNCLFYTRDKTKKILRRIPEGSFILRLSNKNNTIVVSYKNKKDGKLMHHLFTRINAKGRYTIGSAKETELSLLEFIRMSKRLQYVYTPKKLIRKICLF